MRKSSIHRLNILHIFPDFYLWLKTNALYTQTVFLLPCRLSFATDIARGMSYLHQHKMFHGRLHSRNCVIDDRWVCKISGKTILKHNLSLQRESILVFFIFCFQQSHICNRSLNIHSLNRNISLWESLYYLATSYTSSNVIIKAKWKTTSCLTVLYIFLCWASDFGLTAYRREDFETVSNGFNCGDVNRVYCAPEVLLGSSSNMTAAADVYRCVWVSQYKQLIVVKAVHFGSHMNIWYKSKM